MTTPITPQRLQDAGFSLVGSMSRKVSPIEKQTMLSVFSKGIMSIHLTDSSATAYRLIVELGSISTMEQVQALDSVINPVPSDAITGDRLESSGWTPLGDGVFNHQYLRLVTRRTPPASYCVYHRSGEMLGIAWKMTEVSALADVTTRRA